MSKTVLFQTIQFCIGTQFSSIWPIDRTLSDTTAAGQSGPGSDDNEVGAPHSPKLPQYWNLTIRLFSVISRIFVWGVLPLCIEADSVFYIPSRLGKNKKGLKKHLHRNLKRQTSEISHEKTWTWLKKRNFKRETESFLITTQNKAIKTNYVKIRIDKTQLCS